LDRKLLERIRKGEDVLGGAKAENEPAPDVDDEFAELEEKEVAPLVRERSEKKSEMAAPPLPVSGVKRTRDAILAELKAQRKREAETAEAERQAKYPTLGQGFQRVSDKMDKTRVEIDKKGREVLIITDEYGNEKRLVRKVKVEPKVEENDTPSELAKPTQALDHGVKVPELPPAPPEPESDDDEDIFEGVGADYNPLAGLEDDDDSSSDEEGEEQPVKKAKPSSASAELDEIPKASPRASGSPEPPSLDSAAMPPPPPPAAPKRDYFASTSKKRAPEPAADKPVIDPAILAALAKVRTLDPDSALINTEEDVRLKKRAAMLGGADRDLEDMDMGFGSSRFDDAEELEAGERIKLSEWKGTGVGDDDDEDGKKGDKKRKRGPKKRKGDKHSAADVLGVMKAQKERKLG
jgi:hypothetical protein